jgi:hypothetical protein
MRALLRCYLPQPSRHPATHAAENAVAAASTAHLVLEINSNLIAFLAAADSFICNSCECFCEARSDIQLSLQLWNLLEM